MGNEMSPKRKPPVVAIKGSARPDIITQQELVAIGDLQASVWQVERAVHLAVERLRARLFQGASLEDGPLVFDQELKMVRRRKTG
jgi:hypothetical protein